MYKKGTKWTQEMRRKIIAGRLRYFREHPNAMRGRNNSFYGKHHSKETIKIIRLKNTGKPGYFKGKKFTSEHCKHMSDVRKGKHKGKDNHFFGKHHSLKTREIWSKIRRGRRPVNKGTFKSFDYKTIHIWLNNNYGKANHCESRICENRSKRFEWANISGNYTHDIKDYIHLCKKCHSNFDHGNHTYNDLFNHKSLS